MVQGVIKIGDYCQCSKNIVGRVEKIKDGVYYGKTLEGKNWQSKNPTKHNCKWSEEEIEFLKKNTHMTREELAKQLRRKKKSVNNKIQKLKMVNLFQNRKTIEIDEELLTNELISGKSKRAIAKMFEVSCTTIDKAIKNYSLEKYANSQIKPILNQGEKYGTFKIINKEVRGYNCECECGNRLKEVSRKRLIEKPPKGCTQCNWKSVDVGYKDIPSWYWKRIKRCANKRNIEFSVSVKEAWYIFNRQKGICCLSGEKIKFGKRAYSVETTASLDRIDSSKGYSKDNLQWIHKDINKIKMNLTQEKFVEICKKVANWS